MLIPFIVNLLCTVAMLVAYKVYTKDGMLQDTTDTVVSNRRRNTKIFKMAMFITIGHTLTCLPRIVFMPYWLTEDDGEHDFITTVIYYIVTTVYWLNGIANLIIYSLVDDEFMKYAKSLTVKLLAPLRN